jgi:hypothetical protein
MRLGRLQFLLLAFCLIFLVFAGKTGDDPRPVQKDGETNQNFRKRMVRWKRRNDEADEDDLALVAHHNALAHSALSTAREQERIDPDRLSTIQIDRLSRYKQSYESANAEISSARELRNNNPEALTEQDLRLLAPGDAANAERAAARELRKNNPEALTEQDLRILARGDAFNAAVSAARELRKNNPEALTDRDLRILARGDAAVAERAAARELRKNNPEALTDRDLRILAPGDAFNAEFSAKNAELGRQSQAAHMGMELQIHTLPEIASILAHILQSLNLILLAFPRAAIYVGSVSFNIALLSTLTLEQMIEYHIRQDAQCIQEGGRGGTYDPLLRFDLAGNFMTIDQFVEAGGFLQIVHYTMNPADNGLEHALQILQRKHNIPLIGGAILNGGARASGNLPTTAGRICQTALLILPDRTRFHRFQDNAHIPWPSNLDDVPRISLGRLPDTMPLRAIPHVGEAYLHRDTNMTQMRAKVVADLVPLIAARPEYIPVLTDTWNGIVTPELRVLNTGFRFANHQLLLRPMGRLGIVEEDDVRRANLVVVSDNMLTGGKSASFAALAARKKGVPITSISKFKSVVRSADGRMLNREEANSSSAKRSQSRNYTREISSSSSSYFSSSAYYPLFPSSSSSSLLPFVRTSSIDEEDIDEEEEDDDIVPSQKKRKVYDEPSTATVPSTVAALRAQLAHLPVIHMNVFPPDVPEDDDDLQLGNGTVFSGITPPPAVFVYPGSSINSTPLLRPVLSADLNRPPSRFSFVSSSSSTIELSIDTSGEVIPKRSSTLLSSANMSTADITEDEEEEPDYEYDSDEEDK